MKRNRERKDKKFPIHCDEIFSPESASRDAFSGDFINKLQASNKRKARRLGGG